MGTFKSSKTLHAAPAIIPAIATEITTTFRNEGYEVASQKLTNGNYDISITKGGVFKAVLGMKSALKVTIKPLNGNIFIEAGVGIFGQQAIPAIIAIFFLWPVFLTQIWGMIEQSKLDDKVIEIAETYIAHASYQTTVNPQTHTSNGDKFCTSCGSLQPINSKFCPACGTKL